MLHHIKDQNQTRNLAARLASEARIGDVFGLKGTMGAGKSFFTSCFINSLSNQSITVLSPTFNLLYSYQTSKGVVHHFDLYRLRNSEELENIGFLDCLKNGICLIEWPEIAEKFLLKNYTEINIKIIGEKERLINIDITRLAEACKN